MRKSLYILNPREREIIEMARAGNPDPFTEFYLRGPNTGTWWLPGAKRPMWKRGYAKLHKYWLGHDRPKQFEYDHKIFRVIAKHEKSDEFPNHPAFHHNHGFRLLPYGKDFFRDRTPIRTIIGGKGSGKTLNIITVPQLIWAAIYEDFRGFALAPEAKQANEVLRLAWRILQGTLYKERFILNYTRGPNASLTIGNDLVGESSIECYPLLKREDSLLTLTGDTAGIDQAEKFEDPRAILQDVGTRFRGRVISTGRPRLGTLSLVANSDYNDALFQVYDMHETDPDRYRSITVSSYDNIYLTERDIQNFEAYAGGDEEAINVHLKGLRPLGNGKEFSRDVLERMQDSQLDEMMELGLKLQTPGYVRQEAKGVGVVEWLLPYIPEHHYLVVSDPGTDNPPNRNSPAILIWDITGFPGTRELPIPARLAGFIWVFGRGNIKNWANRHAEMTWKYQAVGRNAFDATGYQAGYDEWMLILNNLMSEKINLSGSSKALSLNAAKMLSASGYIKMPRGITGLYNQLQRYDFQQDRTGSKVKQDLVMAFIMSCMWLQRLWYMVIAPESPDIQGTGYHEDRYERFLEDRQDPIVF